MKDTSDIDSKFRFVIIASKRAKELLKGAKPRIKSKTRSPIRIAQDEVKAGLVSYEILRAKKEEIAEEEESVFLGGEEVGEVEEEKEKPRRKRKLKKPEKEEEKEIEEEEKEVEEEEEEVEEEEFEEESLGDLEEGKEDLELEEKEE